MEGLLSLTKFRNRINERSLGCSVLGLRLTWLLFSFGSAFPERVGKKHKAKYAVPVGGEYVVDVDSPSP